MSATLIQVPYDLGREGVGVGRGAPAIARRLEARVPAVRIVKRPDRFSNEVGASMSVVRELASVVRATVDEGCFPLVIAGNCHSSLGTVTGLGSEVGVIWFDAHADFNTPDTTRSGFFDGCALAMLTGTGWSALRSGLASVREENVVLIGACDLEQAEVRRLRESPIARVASGEPLDAALDDLSKRVDSLYLHVDLDVLDPSVGRANRYAAEGGLTTAEVSRAIAQVGQRLAIAGAALTAYAPECDPEGSVLAAADAIVGQIEAVIPIKAGT